MHRKSCSISFLVVMCGVFGCGGESIAEKAYKNCKNQMGQMSQGVTGLDVGFESICQGVKKRCEADPKDSFCTQYSES